jgi:hypothetical protein
VEPLKKKKEEEALAFFSSISHCVPLLSHCLGHFFQPHLHGLKRKDNQTKTKMKEEHFIEEENILE